MWKKKRARHSKGVRQALLGAGAKNGTVVAATPLGVFEVCMLYYNFGVGCTSR